MVLGNVLYRLVSDFPEGTLGEKQVSFAMCDIYWVESEKRDRSPPGSARYWQERVVRSSDKLPDVRIRFVYILRVASGWGREGTPGWRKHYRGLLLVITQKIRWKICRASRVVLWWTPDWTFTWKSTGMDFQPLHINIFFFYFFELTTSFPVKYNLTADFYCLQLHHE